MLGNSYLHAPRACCDKNEDYTGLKVYHLNGNIKKEKVQALKSLRLFHNQPERMAVIDHDDLMLKDI